MTRGGPQWTKIGTVWGHEKGSGFNVELQALPMDGRIVLMPRRRKRCLRLLTARQGRKSIEWLAKLSSACSARRVGVALDGRP